MKIVNGELLEIESIDLVDGKLIIPEGVTTVKSNAIHGMVNIISIYFPKSLKIIEPLAFYHQVMLEKVFFQEGLEVIKESTFAECHYLEEVKFPENLKEIEKFAFKNCRCLKEISLKEGLKKIGNSAFINCESLEKIEIPDSVEVLQGFAFRGCKNLVKITFPKNLEIISSGICEGCTMLEEVILPINLKKIRNSAFDACFHLSKIVLNEGLEVIEFYSFASCLRLESLEIPDSVVLVENNAFEDCTHLKNVKLPKNIKIIRNGTFLKCHSLSTIEIPDTVEIIEDCAFQECINLKKIHLPDSIEKIGKHAFFNTAAESIYLKENIKSIGKDAFGRNYDLKEVISPWGKLAIENLNSKRKVEIAYLYLYANHLLKDKYQGIDEFINNLWVTECISSEGVNDLESISKFKNLFYKMRKEYDIDKNLFSYMNTKTTEEFSYPIWQEIKNIFPWRNNEDMAHAFSEMMEVFGIFHKDKNQRKRIEKFKSIFNEFPFQLMIEDFNRLRIENPWQFIIIEEAFKETENDCMTIGKAFDKELLSCLRIEIIDHIPEEFKFYLKDILLKKDIQRIKKETGTFGKRLNDYVNEHYHKDKVVMYSLKEEYRFDKTIRDTLFYTRLDGHIGAERLHQIFDGCKEPFNEDFYDFLIENLDRILDDDKIGSYIREINKKFLKIQNYYLMEAGVTKVSLKQAIDYIENHLLNYRSGNEFLAEEARKAGIVDQEAFNYYQDIYEENQMRKKRILLPRSNIYEIDGYRIKTELLRKDDPLNMFVGETNYTNCCQRYHGIGHNCMAHAACSPDGGIFVTKLFKDGEWILLTQSWDWQNNNLYCHDNIEGTEYLKKASEQLRKAVMKAYQKDAEFIIEKSKTEIHDYIEKRKKELEKLPEEEVDNLRKELEQLERLGVIKLVTCGANYDDLGLRNYLNKKIKIKEEFFSGNKKYTLHNFQPVNYNQVKPYFNQNYAAYSDAAGTQFILAGSIENQETDEKEELTPIYQDQRKVEMVCDDKIGHREIKKISEIEEQAYPEKMKNYQEKNIADFLNSTIYLGEDWYLIFEKRGEDVIYISDLARMNPSLEEEKECQQKEIMQTLFELISKNKEVEAELKEDKSYLLYLMNKRLGYIEQIGEDISYPYSEEENRKIVSEKDQEELLKSRLRQQNSEIMMHKVKFKKKEK